MRESARQKVHQPGEYPHLAHHDQRWQTAGEQCAASAVPRLRLASPWGSVGTSRQVVGTQVQFETGVRVWFSKVHLSALPPQLRQSSPTPPSAGHSLHIERMSDSPLRALGSSAGGKDEVDRPIVALKFKLAKHQRTVGVAARLPRQREGMEDKVL